MEKRTHKEARPYAGPQDRREKGDWAEMMFMAKAASLGFIVSRPYGATSFDFVVCARWGPLGRVQVRSTWSKRSTMYRISTCGSGRRRYPANEVDFIVGYVVPEDAWYVIPVAEIDRKAIYVSPHVPGSQARWERFREAWGLMRGEEPGYGIELQACAESSGQWAVVSGQEELTAEDAENAEAMELVRLAASRSGCYFLEQTLGM